MQHQCNWFEDIARKGSHSRDEITHAGYWLRKIKTEVVYGSVEMMEWGWGKTEGLIWARIEHGRKRGVILVSLRVWNGQQWMDTNDVHHGWYG